MACTSLFAIVVAHTLSIGAWATSQIHNIKLAPTTGTADEKKDSGYGDAFEVALEIIVVIGVAVIATVFFKPSSARSASVAKKPPYAKNRVSVMNAEKPSVAQPCDTDSYNASMAQVASRGDLEGCTNLMREMRARGITPSGMTLSIILEACVKAGDFDRACVLLETMQKSRATVSKLHSAACVRGFVRVGLLQQAADVLKQAEPNVSAFRILIAAHAENGDSTGVVSTLKMMASHGLALEASSVTSLFGFKPKSNGGDGVLRVFDALIECGLKPSVSVMGMVLKLLASTRNWNLALGFVESLPGRFDVRSEAPMYAELGAACLKAGDVAEASKIHKVMIDTLGAAAVNECFTSRVFHENITQSARGLDRPSFAARPDSTMRLGPTAGRAVAGPRRNLGSPTSTSSPTSSLDSEKSRRPNMWFAASAPNANDFSKLRLEQFISVNGLDAGCETMLRQLTVSQAEWVMDQEFFVKVDSAKGTASAKIVHMVIRAKQKSAVLQDSYPTPADLAKRLADFVEINSIDNRCMKAMESLPGAELRRTMDREFVVKVDTSKGTASAKVVGRILKARNA